MKNCISCVNVLSDDATHCHACNTVQTVRFDEFEAKPKQSDIFLKVLCVLTTLGGIASLVSIPSSLEASRTLGIEVNETLVYLGAVLAAGKITGAILMFLKKRIGLYIYTPVAILAIASGLYSVATMSPDIPNVPGGKTFAIVGGIVSSLFLVTFLIMYWLPVNRRHLS